MSGASDGSSPIDHRIETPVGIVTATLNVDGSVSGTTFRYRKRRLQSGRSRRRGHWRRRLGRQLVLPWEDPRQLELGNVEALTDFTWRIRQAVNAQGFEVDHVGFRPAEKSSASSRNYVLCPGKALTVRPVARAPAKLACLAADGKLAEGDP